MSKHCYPVIIALISLILLLSIQESLGQINECDVRWIKNGQPQYYAYVRAGQTLTIERDPGTAVSFSVWPTSSVTGARIYNLTDWTNGINESSGSTTQGYWYFDNKVGSAATEVWLSVNNLQSIIKINVNNYVPPIPDLTVTSVTFDGSTQPGSYLSGQSVNISCRVDNNGSGTAGPTTLGIYLGSTPADYSHRVASVSVQQLSGLTGRYVDASYTFDATEAGNNYFLFKADDQNAVNEFSENNNTTVRGPFTVTAINQKPTISILSGAGGTIYSTSTTYEWDGDDVDGTVTGYEYSMDGPYISTGSKSMTFTGLTLGPHTFRVRCYDDQGLSSDPATRTFTVATAPPGSALSWSPVQSNTTQTIREIKFPSSLVGYIGTYNSFLKTTDGGQTWNTVNLPYPGQRLGAYFLDELHGWLGDYNSGRILKTTDGGASWTSYLSPIVGAGVTSISFASSTVGWAVGYPKLVLKTTDGGTSWTQQSADGTGDVYSFWGITATSTSTAILVGDGGRLRRTTNGGTSWSTITSGTTEGLRRVRFPSASIGYIVGTTGTILKSTNGGASWVSQVSTTAENLYDESWLSTTEGWVVGYSGMILRTTDGGSHWIAQVSGTTSGLYAAHFNSSTDGWAGGSTGLLLHGAPPVAKNISIVHPAPGETWVEKTDQTVQWASENVSSINISLSTNGGLTWNPLGSDIPANLKSYPVHVPENSISRQCRVKLEVVESPTTSVSSLFDFSIIHTPVIFIPGIMGSPLFNDADQNGVLTDAEETWLNLPEVLNQKDDRILNPLNLAADGVNPVNPDYHVLVAPNRDGGGVTLRHLIMDNYIDKLNVGHLPLWFYRNLFKTLENTDKYLLDNSTNQGTGEDAFCFTYDWRKSILSNVSTLGQFVDFVKARTGASKVNIIAHSMGGLLAKKFAETRSNDIKKLIFIAVPNLGAPKIYNVLLTGNFLLDPAEPDWKNLFLFLAVNWDKTMEISKNMPGAYQLFPSPKYSDYSLNNGVSAGFSNYQYCFTNPANVKLSYDQTVTYFRDNSSLHFNSDALSNLATVHASLWDISLDAVPEVYNIVGYDKPTPGMVEARKILDKYGNTIYEYGLPIWNMSGDGTVPLRSAEILNSAKRKADYYIKGADHSTVPSSKECVAILEGLLQDPPKTTGFSDPDGNIRYSPPPSYLVPDQRQVAVACPVAVHAYDIFNNHTGPTSDSTWEANIPGSTYIPGNLSDSLSQKTILLPSKGIMTIKVVSLASSRFDLSICGIDSGHASTSVSFDSIGVRDSSVAMCVLDSVSSHLTMSLDLNHDGVVDTVYGAKFQEMSTTLQVQRGWNLVSMPRVLNSYAQKDVFGSAISKAYAYETMGGYKNHDTLGLGKGYWLKFSGPEMIKITGIDHPIDTIPVHPGWNLLGSVSSPIQVTDVMTQPDTLGLSSFYMYNGRYAQTTMIQPGGACWVKSNSDGFLIMSAEQQPLLPTRRQRQMLASELPPPPPDEVESLSHEFPLRFTLGQAYPSPFNPSTTIQYQLPKESNVNLRVYDILGRVVATLIEVRQTAGYHSVSWNASAYGSGIYFYKLEATSSGETREYFSDVKKMVLLK